MGHLDGGFEPRYIVTRTDGKVIPEHKRYMVLEYSGDDPFAVQALYHYANLIARENKQLSLDLYSQLTQPEKASPQH